MSLRVLENHDTVRLSDRWKKPYQIFHVWLQDTPLFEIKIDIIMSIYLIMTLKINFIKLNNITLLKNTSGLFYRALYNVRSIFCKNYTFGDVNTFDVFQLSYNLLGRPMKSQLPHVLFINFYFLNILRNDIDNHDLDYIYFQRLSRQTSM